VKHHAVLCVEARVGDEREVAGQIRHGLLQPALYVARRVARRRELRQAEQQHVGLARHHVLGIVLFVAEHAVPQLDRCVRDVHVGEAEHVERRQAGLERDDPYGVGRKQAARARALAQKPADEKVVLGDLAVA
jgi:hypothetical protein